MKYLLPLIIFLNYPLCYALEEQMPHQAQEVQKVEVKKHEVQKTEELKKPEAKDLRYKSDYFFYGMYSPIDLMIPSKLGFSVGLTNEGDNTWEFEYLRGSLSVPFIIEDLGKMTDERISIIRRSYFGGNTFNVSYGISYFNFSMNLGDKLLNGLTGGAYPSIDLVQIKAYGVNVGIGNRWIFNKNISFGVDWISWYQPLTVTEKKSYFMDYSSNQQDRDDVDKAMKTISYFPRFVLFKLQLGILF